MAFAAIGTALSIGSSILGAGASASAQKYAQKTQVANQYQQALINQQREYSQIQAGLQIQDKQNTESLRSDLRTLINTSYTAGLLNLQRSMQKRQVAAEIQAIGRGRLQSLAQGELAAAATETVGASVNAVKADIALKMGEATIQVKEQDEVNALNYNTGMRNLYQSYMDNQPLLDDSVPDIPGLPPKYGAVPVSVGGAMLGAGINAIGGALAQNASLNLGPSINVSPNFASNTASGLGSMSNFKPSLSFKL